MVGCFAAFAYITRVSVTASTSRPKSCLSTLCQHCTKVCVCIMSVDCTLRPDKIKVMNTQQVASMLSYILRFDQ